MFVNWRILEDEERVAVVCVKGEKGLRNQGFQCQEKHFLSLYVDKISPREADMPSVPWPLSFSTVDGVERSMDWYCKAQCTHIQHSHPPAEGKKYIWIRWKRNTAAHISSSTSNFPPLSGKRILFNYVHTSECSPEYDGREWRRGELLVAGQVIQTHHILHISKSSKVWIFIFRKAVCNSKVIKSRIF